LPRLISCRQQQIGSIFPVSHPHPSSHPQIFTIAAKKYTIIFQKRNCFFR